MVPELLSLLIDDSTARLLALTSACFRQDFKAVRAQAHSLQRAAPSRWALPNSLPFVPHLNQPIGLSQIGVDR